MRFQIENTERGLKLLEQFKVQPEDQVRVTENNLRKTVEAVFSKMGLDASDSELGADVLVKADMRGVDTHGVSNMLRSYVTGYGNGEINPHPNWTVTRETPSTANIDGDRVIIFTPNTITYAVDVRSNIARRILASKIGVVWHTTYTGKTMEDMSAKFGANVKRLNTTKNVWSTDATFKDTSGKATFTQAETKKFQSLLNMANGSLKKATPYLKVINQNKNDYSVSTKLKIFLNTYIRGGEQIRDTKNVLARFDKYYDAVLQKKVDSVRTPGAKKNWNAVKQNGLKEIKRNKASLYYVIATYITFQTAKTMVIRKLQQAEGIGTFLRTPNGYRVTAPEGFVAIDHIGKALKLVDRLEFSKANFTVDKNWVKG